MKTYISLTETLVKAILSEDDLITIKEFETEDESILLEVLVPKDKIGLVIGSKGKTANAIRTIVQAAGYVNNNVNVKVNFDFY